jgi:hypothetical protein
MADPAPGFEIQDREGSVYQEAGTVGTPPVAVPAVAGPVIEYAFIRCAIDNTPKTKRLLYSLDGGTTYCVLATGEYVGWPMRGTPTQILIKGNVAAVGYEIILNREPA